MKKKQDHVETEPRLGWPDPAPEMLETAAFEAVWQCIKRWDISVPDAYSGYEGATGNHVRAILDALSDVAQGPPCCDPTASPTVSRVRTRLKNTIAALACIPAPETLDSRGSGDLVSQCLSDIELLIHTVRVETRNAPNVDALNVASIAHARNHADLHAIKEE